MSTRRALLTTVVLVAVLLSVWIVAVAESESLSAQARQLAREQGISIVNRDSTNFRSLYQENRYLDVPSFITSDSVLNVSHVVLDASIRAVEMGILRPALQTFNNQLWVQCLQAYQETAALEVRDAFHQLLPYIYVAQQLLGPKKELPTQLSAYQKEIEQELTLLRAHGEATTSPLLGYKVDYTQFKPRGHYTVSNNFSTYFQAVKWLALPFRALDSNETVQALLLTHTIVGNEQLLAIWEKFERFQKLLAGHADDLSIQEYETVMSRVYKPGHGTGSFTNQTKLTEFVEEVRNTQKTPRALPYWAAAAMIPRESAQGFALIPSRLIPDSWIFQELVYGNVGTQTKPRTMPKGLDLFAVFGNKLAAKILRAKGAFTYANYGQQLSMLKAKRDAIAKEWEGTLYWKWMSAIEALQTRSQVAGFPDSELWQRKQLNTSLGGWTLLRHDTVLYTKESITMAMGLSAYSKGYIEPYPSFYATLATLIQQFTNYIQNVESSSTFTIEELHLPELEKFLRFLESVATKEVEGKPLSEDDYKNIYHVVETFRSLTDFSKGMTASLALGNSLLPVVTDVHTDSNSGRFLLEGVGHVRPMWIVVTRNNKPTLMRGGVFAYYEWIETKRLTDEEWELILETNEPTVPEWTNKLLVGNK